MSLELISFEKYAVDNGVYILSPVKNEFENLYLEVRKKEQRIYSENELKLLPFASNLNPHKNEWIARAISFIRFKNYLSTKKENLALLDLGCGNGWFCGHLSQFVDHNYYCVDVNLMELKQGRKVFNSEKLKFIYADIISVKFADALFDIITINAAIQYFPDINLLIKRLVELLKVNGEIHIIDSPLYSDAEAAKAKQRTLDYYSSIDFKEMANYYFHHKLSELTGYNYKILYDPNSYLNKFKRSLGFKTSPFPWVTIKK